MKPRDDVPGILDDLYAGVLDPAAWSRALVRICDLIGASGAHLVSLNPGTGQVLRDEAQRLDPGLAADYREHWTTRDILVAPVLRVPVGEPTTDYQLTSLRTWEQCELFNELALPYDVPYILATLLHQSAEKIVALSLKTSARHGPFHGHEARRLKTIIPHLRRSLAIKDRLALSEVRADNLATSLDSLRLGVVIIDSDGRIVEASAAARELMRTESGIGCDPDRRVRLREPAGTELYRWIVDGAPPPSCMDGLLQVKRPNAQPLSILVASLPRRTTTWLCGDSRWMLLLFDPERGVQASPELIAHDLGISAREAEVAALLVTGLDVKCVASRLSISVHTIRTHVKSIFGKTGMRSQAELIHRIARGPAAIKQANRPIA